MNTLNPPQKAWRIAAPWMLIALCMSFPPPYALGAGGKFPNTASSSYILLTLLYTLTAILTASAPLIAHRLGGLAIFAAASTFIPLNMMQTGRVNFSLCSFFALLLVMFIVLRRHLLYGVIAGLIAAVMPLYYAFYPQTNLWTIGTTGVVSPENEAKSQGIETGAMYLLGIVLVFALAVVMGRGARQKQEQQQIENQAAEVDARAELARDLHDVVAHRISMVAVRAETAPYAHPNMDEKSKAAFAEIAHDARGALDEMREVLGVLHRGEETQRRPQPQTSDIPSLFEDARSVGTPVVARGEIPEMNAVNGHVAYRVIQEALTNARRHGAGNAVTINLQEDDGIVILVSNPTRRESFVMGRGLSGMRERVIQRGGEFRADISDGLFIIEVKLPKG